jgi:FlaA1/EpsC-like NDP-sugar epimerase
MEQYIEDAKLLFTRFGWYSICLVIITTALMIPINMLYKKFIKKEELDRVRKTISSITVFVIAFSVVAFFTGVCLREPITMSYLSASSVCCGSLSMGLWAVIKLIRDVGLKPILNAIANSKKAKEWLKEVGVSQKLIDAVTDKVKTYMKDKNIVTLEEYLQRENDIIGQLRLQVAGFVTSENVHKTITNILQPIKNKLK